MVKNLNKQGLEKQRWRCHFKSLINQHFGKSCFPERFKWERVSLKREDERILSQLKGLLSSQLKACLWLSYFPRCDEVDIRSLWQELTHLEWAFPSFSYSHPRSYSHSRSHFQFHKGTDTIGADAGIGADIGAGIGKDKDIGKDKKNFRPSFFQVHFSHWSHLKNQMQGASYCPWQKEVYCIYEPKQNLCREVEVDKAFGALIPALAFDKKGRRLGRGGAYFDRVLKDFQGIKIGVGYSWQLAEALPYEEHDISMDVVVSEKQSQAFTLQGQNFLKGVL